MVFPKTLLMAALAALACSTAPVYASSTELAKLDRLMAQQLQLERATTALQMEAQQTIADNQRLLALYQQEHKALSDALARQQQQQDEVAQQRGELLAQQAQQEQRTKAYQQHLQQGLTLLQSLWGQLPPPLVADLQPSWLQLQDQQLGLSERFSAMIGMLTRLEEFNSAISLHQGSLQHNGEPWQAEQLYVGLSQGYYRLPDGQGAGVGEVVDGQWQWCPSSDMAAQINRAFDIYQGKQPVEFVTLPLSAVEANQ